MQKLRTVTSLDVSAVAGHHAMPAMLLFLLKYIMGEELHHFMKKIQIFCIGLWYNNWYQNKIMQEKLLKRKSGWGLKSNLHNL